MIPLTWLRGDRFVIVTVARFGWRWQVRDAVPSRADRGGPIVGPVIWSGWSPWHRLAVARAEHALGQ